MITDPEKKMWLEFGWFRGEGVTLLQITLLDFGDTYVHIFGIKIAKFAFNICMNRY